MTPWKNEKFNVWNLFVSWNFWQAEGAAPSVERFGTIWELSLQISTCDMYFTFYVAFVCVSVCLQEQSESTGLSQDKSIQI